MFFKKIELFKNKAFSLVELLVTLSISLIIGGIAITNYGRYKKHSEQQLILSNLNLIKTGFETCLKVKSFNKCDSPSEIKMQNPLSAVLTARSNTSNKKVCFLMEFKGHKGCVDNQNNQTRLTQLNLSSPSTRCTLLGVCIP